MFVFGLQARASLGLSISHGIVERHGGWIEVESEVGWGRTFTVMLLVAEGQRGMTMRATSLYGLLFAGLLAVTGGPRLRADDPIVSSDGLTCTVDGNRVELSWTIQFFAPIDSWLIARDGEIIAKLEPEATSYTDSHVPDGEHIYTLSAENALGSGNRSGVAPLFSR